MIERRYTSGLSRVEIQTRSDGKPVITGYASVFFNAQDRGTEYQLWDDVVERIMPGAFDKAINEDDVRGLFNHDPSLILGRNKSNTLRLSVDSTGLRYEIDVADTQIARDVVEHIRRGDITGSSFGFMPDKTVFVDDRENKRTIVERHSVRLFDVSPVTFPAYTSASTGLRNSADAQKLRGEIERWKRRSSPRSVIIAKARCAELLLKR